MVRKIIRIILIILLVIVAVPMVLGILSGVFNTLFSDQIEAKKKEEALALVQYVTEVQVEGYPFSFMIPAGYEREEHNTFNAFYTNEQSNFGVYGYRSENLEEGQTVEDLFAAQNKLILDARESVKQVKELEKRTENGIDIMEIVYEGKKDGSQNLYYFYMLQFPEKPDTFAYVMINCIPEYNDTYEETFDKMVATAKLSNETYMKLNKDIVVDGYDMQFTLGRNFQEEEHASFDAYYSDGSAYFGIFGYDASIVSADTNRQQLFKEQNESNIMHKEEAQLIRELEQYEVNEVNISKEVYSSLEDGSEVYYLCYLVEFDDDPEKFAHIMIFVMPQYATANEAYFDEMVASGKLVKSTVEE